MNRVDSPSFVSRSAIKILSGTLACRVTGLMRDMAMAFFFGAGAALATFLLAYRFVYLFRRLFGEGLLHQGFIPHFEQRRLLDPVKAASFFRDLFWTLACILLLAILGAGWILSQFHGEVAALSLRMLPGLLFLCLFGLTSGLLHAERRFFLPAVSPAIFNLIWVGGVVAFARFEAPLAASYLALLLSGALCLQFVCTVPLSWKFLRNYLGLKEVFVCHPFSIELKRLAGPLFLGVVGVAAVQVGSAIDAIFAHFASPKGPAYLWYAIRMQQLPLALFGLSLSSALLPSLSRKVEIGDVQAYRSLIEAALAKLLLLMIPCTVAIFVLGASSVNLLFGRGDFDLVATKETTVCLWAYGIGLVPMALTQVLASAFYATRDYKTPSRGFVYSALLNIALNGALVFLLDLGTASVALATSCTALFNALYLKRRLVSTPLTGGIALFPGAGKYTLFVCASGLITFGLGFLFLGDATLSILEGSTDFTRCLGAQVSQFGIQTLLFFGLVGGIGRWYYSSVSSK